MLRIFTLKTNSHTHHDNYGCQTTNSNPFFHFFLSHLFSGGSNGQTLLRFIFLAKYLTRSSYLTPLGEILLLDICPSQLGLSPLTSSRLYFLALPSRKKSNFIVSTFYFFQVCPFRIGELIWQTVFTLRSNLSSRSFPGISIHTNG